MEKVLPMNQSINITIKNKSYNCIFFMSFQLNQQISLEIRLFEGKIDYSEKVLFSNLVDFNESDIIRSPNQKQIFITYNFGLEIIKSTVEKYLIYRDKQESIAERFKNIEIIEEINFN
jgi:hypothetical protein